MVVIALVITVVGQHLGKGDGKERWKLLRPIETISEKIQLEEK